VVSRFHGRDAELSILEDLASRAAADRLPTSAIVIGDPGTGKSRLLDEAASRSPIRRSVRVRGFEAEAEIGLAAVRELLEEMARVPEAGRPLVALLEGRAAAPVEPLPLFEAMYRALETLGPCLILADDLHWTDRSSLALVHYLLRGAAAEGRPVALVAASRPGPAASSFARSLRQVLGDRLHTLELGPLDRTAGVRLVLDLAPDIGERAAVDLWQRAAGSPFWLEVIARVAPGDSGQAVLADRLRGAGADAVALLALLTLAGRPLTADEVMEIEGWPSHRVDAAARDLIGSGLAIQEQGVLAVSHDLVREAAARQLPTALRRRIHRRLALWLEREAGEDHLLLLAAVQHRRDGGLPAVDLVERLLRSSRRRLLGGEGVRILGAVADEGGTATGEIAAEVAELAMEVGEYEEALTRWVAVVSGAPDPGTRAQAALGASRAAYELERLDEARAYLEQASAWASADPVLAIEVEAHRSDVIRWLEHRGDVAKASGLAALEAARQLASAAGGIERISRPARRAYLHALMAVSDVGLQEEDPVGTLEIADEVSTVAAGFDLEASIRAGYRGGGALFALGRPDEAETRLRVAWDEGRRAGIYVATVDAGWWLTRSLYMWGRLAEAVAVGRECASLGRRIGKMPRAVSTWVHAARISLGERRPELVALRDEIDAEPDEHFRLMARQILGLALARVDGGPEDAAEQVRLARQEAEGVGCARCLGELILRGAEVLARAGALDEARTWIAERGRPEDEPYPLAAWWHARAMASIAVGAGDPEAAEGLKTVATGAQTLGLALEVVWAQLDLGQLLLGVDRSEAAKALRAVGEAADRLGARTERDLAERALRALGVRTWRRGRGGSTDEGVAALTEREREIATRVAAGASNPDIAQSLFLSRKTVERHVSNIMAKLGVRNRAQLAALLSGPGDESPQDEGVPR
jgi:DNA-binding CsgD family transcriptional regulator/tetratricopeptide (TPR) repeat protein